MSALAAGLTGGLGVVGNVAGMITNAAMNRNTRKWNERMWHEQNAYNSPSAQMQRYRDAGLNPNLIYGQGNSGNSTHTPEAAFDLDTSKLGESVQYGAQAYWNARANKRADMLAAGDLEVKKATVDNLDAQATQSRNNALWITTKHLLDEYKYNEHAPRQTAILDQEIRRLWQKNALYDLEKANLKGRNDLLKYQLNSLYPAQVANYKANAFKSGKQAKMIQFDLDNYGQGIAPNSPWYVRSGARALQKYKQNRKEGKGIWSSIWDTIWD